MDVRCVNGLLVMRRHDKDATSCSHQALFEHQPFRCCFLLPFSVLAATATHTTTAAAATATTTTTRCG